MHAIAGPSTAPLARLATLPNGRYETGRIKAAATVLYGVSLQSPASKIITDDLARKVTLRNLPGGGAEYCVDDKPQLTEAAAAVRTAAFSSSVARSAGPAASRAAAMKPIVTDSIPLR